MKLTVSSAAGYWGGYGISITGLENNSYYVQDDSPAAESQFHARFYFKPNDDPVATATPSNITPTATPWYFLTITPTATTAPTKTMTPTVTKTATATPTGGNAATVVLYSGFSGATEIFKVEMQNPTSSTHQIRVLVKDDANTWHYSSWHFISGDWNCVEIAYFAAEGTGQMELIIGGEVKETISGLDTHASTVDSVRLGLMNVVGTYDTMFFDDYTSTRSTYIGLLENPGVAPTPTVVAGKTNKVYAYDDDAHKHAVTSVGITDENNNQSTNTYEYDENGNMTCRIENGLTYIQSYNAENRIMGMALVDGDCDTLPSINDIKLWAFTYDGDGNKVKQVYTDNSIPSTLTTYYYAGGSYEVQVDELDNTTVKQYYAIAGVSVGVTVDGEMSYFLIDHLGSIVAVTDDTGVMTSETRYLPYGEVRTDVGTISETNYGYTNQEVVPDLGLMDYNARFYDSSLGRFIQADTVIPSPGSSQSYNRYSYVMNNPINHDDPTGHVCRVRNPEYGTCSPTSAGFQTTKTRRVATKPTKATGNDITVAVALEGGEVIDRINRTRGISFIKRGDSFIISGGRTARAEAGINPYTNIVSRNKSGLLTVSQTGGWNAITKGAKSAVSSGLTWLGIGIDVLSDAALLENGEYTAGEFTSAAMVDVGGGLLSAALAGAVTGAITGGLIAGAASVGLGTGVGIVAGALIGAGVAIMASIAIDSVKPQIIEAVGPQIDYIYAGSPGSEAYKYFQGN